MKRRTLRDFEEEPEEEEEEEEMDEEAQREEEIRAQLAGVPFETLLRVQKKNAAAEARAAVQKRPGDTGGGSHRAPRPKKRAGDAPAEMTSKKPVSWVREVVHVQPRAATRDPRFDSLSGHFNSGLYRASYRFLEDMRAEDEQRLRDEVADLTARAQEARELAAESPDDDDAADTAASVEAQLHEARRALAVLLQQNRSEAAHERAAERKRSARRLAASSVARGKGAFYMKRSQVKRLEAENAYRELRRTAGSEGVERFIARQNQRAVSREKRRGPAFRTRDDSTNGAQ